jgi:hypothetical protein
MTNGGKVPVPPLVMVVQTLYHLLKYIVMVLQTLRSFEEMVLQTFCSTNTNRQIDD